jgi:TatA/E family protein of Tat protein translocase
MFGIGTQELIIILVIVLLVFGSKKLPELAQGLGKGIKEFRKASTEIQEELDINKPLDETTTTKKSHTESTAPAAEHEKKSEEDDDTKTED